MALKQAVREKILEEVIRGVKSEGWKVLIVDQLSTRMISSCVKMSEIMTEGITLVEDITKKREPLPTLEAVYLLTPIEDSVNRLIKDFDSSSTYLYKQAHIFFTEACPEELFKKLCKSNIAKFIKTLKEVNIAFLAHESQVFSLDSVDGFESFYGCKLKEEDRVSKWERYAEQIATLCSTLGEYPIVRYRTDYQKNFEFARMVQQKLDAYRADDPNMGQGSGKDRSQLIILDRGFDPISPLLHELTLQAMAYDLLPIKNDVYSYLASQGDTQKKESLLDENDKLWSDLRHNHIAIVSQEVPRKLREFGESKKMTVQEKASMKDLSQMIKKMPQYQKELNNYSMHLRLASDCMEAYRSRGIDKLCIVEQNLAMGTDQEGEKIKGKDYLKLCQGMIVDESISVLDKCRILLLYLIQVGGVTEENLKKLLEHAHITSADAAIIHNVTSLSVPVLLDPSGTRNKQAQPYLPQHRPDRSSTEQVYQTARWTPYVKDIMSEVVEDKLDSKKFSQLQESRTTMMSGAAPVSARYGQWHKDRGGQAPTRVGPRLIIFVMGGVALSEIRCAYEVTSAVKNWEIIIGSTHILTPEGYLSHLKQLSG